MDKNTSEIFGHFDYDESLTYEELLSIEDSLMAEIERLLQRAGAVHVDFTPLGDTLRFQCAFEEHKLYIFRRIVHLIAEILPKGISGRMLCIDKTLAGQHMFWFAPGQWQEEAFALPHLAPEGLKVWQVNTDGKHLEISGSSKKPAHVPGWWNW